MARGDGRSSQGQGDGFEGTQTTAALIWLCLSASIGLLLFALYWWKKKDKKKTPTIRIGPNMQPESGAMHAQTAGGMRRRPRTARQRMMTRRQEYDDYDESEEEIFDEGSGDETGPIAPEVPWKDEEPSGKVGTKKLRKLQGKAEKKEQREQEQRDREERKKQEELRIKEQKEEEELERIQQEKEEEQERLRKEEQERKDHEEYLMLKEAFTVEEEGESGLLSEQESQALLQEFIDFVQNKKVVMLEELASHFDLRVQEAIQRLEDLQEMGRLTGVMDDRGKFIYISQEELEDVARYVKQRGRVAISDLAEASSSLISLQGSNSESGINSQPIEVS